jgi:hypothetical protein
MYGKQGAKTYSLGVAKLFQCLFVHFKAGSELLPVRSGVAKLKALKVI